MENQEILTLLDAADEYFKQNVPINDRTKIKGLKMDLITIKNVIVKASIGHISAIRDSGVYNMGIDPNTFDMDLAINKDKKDIVKELKAQTNISDLILLASDPDREGEAIAWSLKKFLDIPIIYIY